VRARTIRLLSQVRENTYVYGPKNDDYAHFQWAEPYPPDAGQAIAEAAKEARADLVHFVWAVSPGLLQGAPAPGGSIKYSSAADFQRLTTKIEAMRALGVGDFAVFVDDLTDGLVWDEDKAAFATLADAHVSLLNRLNDYLKQQVPTTHLLVVGTKYATNVDGWESYNRIWGQSLEPDIEVLWTGNQVYSETMTASDMTAVDGLLGRKVTIWDNWPTEVIPLRGRSSDLASTVGGFLSNPVLNEDGRFPPSAFWQVLGTIGDYTWNPGGYDPEQSFAAWQPQLDQAQR
jgi:hyaluronoglucosaminidase